MSDEKNPSFCFPIRDLMLQMVERIGTIAQAVQQDQVECFLSEVMQAERIFVVGAGRSGFVAKAFAMRLMHLGMTSYVVGETVTPSLHPTDTLIAFSGSGTTKSVLDACEATRLIGGRVCLVTGSASSPMMELADYIVFLPTESQICSIGPDQFELRQLRGQHRSITDPCTPIGTLFETAALIFSDTIISAMIELKHCPIEEIISRYTNMQ